MRKRSLTNSRPAEDLDYRSDYLHANRFCELAQYFPEWDRGWVSVTVPGMTTHISKLDTPSVEVHHAFGGRMGKWDREWNLVAVCRHVHTWCERYKTDGRILALHHKILKGEWDSDDAFACLGKHPLGWAFDKTPELSWVVPYWEAVRKVAA